MVEAATQVARLKLRVGSMELEYEGDPSFLTGGIEALLVTMGGLANKVPAETPSPEPAEQVPPANATGNVAPTPNGAFTFSTNTIAAHLDAKTGPELVICAMTQLELVQGKASSSRPEVIAEMKSATTYFKQTMVNNLSSSISGLVKAKRINQITKDIYALSATERKQVEAKIAEIG